MPTVSRLYCLFLFVSLVQWATAAPVKRDDYSGDGTYYYTELGSCGDYSDDWDYIAAVNTDQMENDDNPNDNPNCGRIINVEGPDGTVQVEAVDTCPTCDWGDIDLSPAAFSEIAGLNEGRVPISWEWA